MHNEQMTERKKYKNIEIQQYRNTEKKAIEKKLRQKKRKARKKQQQIKKTKKTTLKGKNTE